MAGEPAEPPTAPSETLPDPSPASPGLPRSTPTTSADAPLDDRKPSLAAPTTVEAPSGDLPSEPHALKQFSAVHEAMAGVGAKAMVGVEELEKEVQEGEERERLKALEEAAALEAAEEPLADMDHFAPTPEQQPQEMGMVIDISSASGQTSENEIARRLLLQPASARVGDKAAQLSATAQQEPVDAQRGGTDPEVDGMAIELDGEGSQVEQAEGTNGVSAMPSASNGVGAGDSTSDSQTTEKSSFRLLSDFWRNNVSRVHLPRYWLHQDPLPPPAADPTNPPPARPIGCTLTLRFPDATTRDFTVPTSDGHVARKDAKNAAAALVLASSQLLDELKMQRETLGPEDQDAEKKKLKLAREGADKPYEALVVGSQKWMVAGDFKWEFDTDELNAAHGCTLRVPITATTDRSYTVDKIHHSHREAKDAAARLALKDGIPQLWEQAYKDRMKVDSGGYISFAAAAEEGAAQGEKKENEVVDGETANPIEMLGAEARAAFGTFRALTWASTTVPQPGPSGAATGHPLLSASVTVTFPSTAGHPSPPTPLTYAVPARYLSKHHAYIACSLAAFKDGIVEKLKPYKDEREAEREKKAEERVKEREEKKEKLAKPPPRTGTVKWEDLDKLDNPVAYLNQCAQVWTGNGSPLKFEYDVEDGDGPPGKKRPKHHGCSLSVVISSTLTKIYRISPSAATPSRPSAKEAAIRLAFRERVLDLMMPPDFDPEAPASGSEKKADRKEKRAEKRAETKAAKNGPGAAGAVATRGRGAARGGHAFAPSTHSAPASLVNGYGGGRYAAQPNSAVGYLDRFCQEWLGPGGLPLYDIRQNNSALPSPFSPVLYPSLIISHLAAGYFGAVLRIPLPPAVSHLPPPPPKTFWVDFAHSDRSSAQEAVANVAVMDGIVEQIKAEVPPAMGGFGPSPGGFARGASGGRGAGPFGAGGGAPFQQQQQNGFGPPQRNGNGAGGSRTKRAAPSPASSAQAMAFAAVEPAQKKQRVWGAPASETQPQKGDAMEVDEDRSAVEKEEKDEGGAVSTLLSGLRAKLGNEPSVRPAYKIVEKDSLFGASVSVPLSSTAKDSRTFRIPPSFSSKSLARAAAAQAALSAGVLDLLESRTRVPVLKGASKQQQLGRREKPPQKVMTPEEQEQARRRAYGGLGGAAVGVAAPATSPLAAKALMPVASAPAPVPAAVKGKSVVALEAHCRTHNLPAPVFTRLKEGEKLRVSVVVKDLRFELPKPSEKPGEAEERLSVKVLKHLQKLEAEKKNGGV
ncbi:hypothetical protein JCM6882_009421 [Rhodosporidiobolus microsporus]